MTIALNRSCISLIAVVLAGMSLRAQDADPQMGPKTIGHMIAAIRTESLDDKMQAAVSLGVARVNRPDALKALTELLGNDYAPARASALYALGRSRAESAVMAIATALTDADENVRVEACRALAEAGGRGQARSLPLDDPSVAVRLAAVEAAAVLGGKGAAEGLVVRCPQEQEADVRCALLHALAKLGFGGAAGPAEAALADEELLVQLAALEYFSVIPASGGAEGVEDTVAGLLSHPASLARRSSVRALANLAGDDAIDLLLPLADDPDHTVRRALAEVLGQRKPAAAVRAVLARLMADASREVRRAASVALVTHAEREASMRAEAERIALDATGYANSAARREGLWVLGMLRSKAGFPAILRRAVRAIPTDADGNVTGDLRESRMIAWVVQRTAYAPATELMVSYFRQGDDEALRAHAARAIGSLGHTEAVPMLCKAALEIGVADGMKFYVLEGYARTVTIETLGELGNKEALEALTTIVTTMDPTDEEANVQKACDILARRGYANAAERLKGAAVDPLCPPEIAVMVARAVETLTGEKLAVEPPEEGSPYPDFFINARDDHRAPAP